MATFRPPGAEKLIFSDKTLACLTDCAPKHKEHILLHRRDLIKEKKKLALLPSGTRMRTLTVRRRRFLDSNV
jgi:hypothetical protein